MLCVLGLLCPKVQKSLVHSQTLPVISNSPNALGGNAHTEEVLATPSPVALPMGSSPGAGLGM